MWRKIKLKEKVLRTLQDNLKIAQRYFNRREYEQFIVPIIQCLEDNIKASNVIALREPLNKYIEKCKNDIDNHSVSTIDEEEVIEVQKVKEILDTNKGLVI